MAGWSIVGGNGDATITDDGLATFQPNTGTREIIYTITYTDENGNCGSTTIRQQGNCSSPGPEPPQPVGVCNFTQSVNNIPYNGFTGTVITYNAEQCEASSIIATSTIAGVDLLVENGVITMEVGQGTDSQRTIDVTVKVTIDGGEKTYDFTFIQSGSSPTPPTGYGTIIVNLTNKTGSEIRLYGEVKMYISKTPANPCSNYNGVNVYLVPSHSTGWVDETNNIIVPVRGIKQWSYNVESQYLDGSYYIMETDCGYHLPLDLYTMYYTKNSNKVKKGNGLYHTKVTGRQYLTDRVTINVEADYLGVADNVGKIILADENTKISTIPSDKTYVILLPNQTKLPA